MTFRVVIDTNIWIRILLRGRVTLPILEAFNQDKFELVMSQPLMVELRLVRDRPRLKERIDPSQAFCLERQLQNRASWVELVTIPPNCRDPKDLPVLAMAIDGKADIIVTGDDDLRTVMATYNIQLLGVNSFLECLE